MPRARVTKGGWSYEGRRFNDDDVVEAPRRLIDRWIRDGYCAALDGDPVERGPSEPEPVDEPVEHQADDGEEAEDELDLASLSKPELVALAERRGIDVVRGDGEDGPPLKNDYIAALSG